MENKLNKLIQQYEAGAFFGVKDDEAYCHIKGTPSNLIKTIVSLINDNKDNEAAMALRSLIYDITLTVATSNEHNCSAFIKRLGELEDVVKQINNECKIINLDGM